MRFRRRRRGGLDHDTEVLFHPGNAEPLKYLVDDGSDRVRILIELGVQRFEAVRFVVDRNDGGKHGSFVCY